MAAVFLQEQTFCCFVLLAICCVVFMLVPIVGFSIWAWSFLPSRTPARLTIPVKSTSLMVSFHLNVKIFEWYWNLLVGCQLLGFLLLSCCRSVTADQTIYIAISQFIQKNPSPQPPPPPPWKNTPHTPHSLKQSWLPAFWNKIKTHKALERTLTLYKKHGSHSIAPLFLKFDNSGSVRFLRVIGSLEQWR